MAKIRNSELITLENWSQRGIRNRETALHFMALDKTEKSKENKRR